MASYYDVEEAQEVIIETSLRTTNGNDEVAPRKQRRTRPSDVARLLFRVELPKEIMAEIISRLFVGNILPLLYPSVELKRIVFGSHFAGLFQSHHGEPDCTFFGVCEDNNEAELIEYENDNSAHTYDLDFSCLKEDEIEQVSTRMIVSSCNGWLLVQCVHDCGDERGEFESLRLVNPVIRRCLIFHRTPAIDRKIMLDEEPRYALGYSCKTGKYKVVKVCRSISHTSFEVLDILGENKTWKHVEFDYQGGEITTDHVVLEGALHWLYDSRDSRARRNVILRFDIDEEKLDFIPSPYTENFAMRLTSLSSCRGLLYVGAYNLVNRDFNYIKGLEIWVMKEYGVKSSWAPVAFVNDYHFSTFYLTIARVLHNDKFMFLVERGKAFMIYDARTGAHERVASISPFTEPNQERLLVRVFPFNPSFSDLSVHHMVHF